MTENNPIDEKGTTPEPKIISTSATDAIRKFVTQNKITGAITLLESTNMDGLLLVEGNSLSLINLLLQLFKTKPDFFKLIDDTINYYKLEMLEKEENNDLDNEIVK